MVTIFQIFIVFGVIIFGAIIVIGIKAVIEDFRNYDPDRNKKFQEWLKREDKSENFSDWLRKNYPYE